VLWTPTVLIFDDSGKERYRFEGYLPRDEFAAHLVMGLARVAFMNKRWAEAEQLYNEVVEKYPHTSVAPAAVYWLGVARYKKTNDHHVLESVVTELKQKYPDSPWNKRAIPWAA
jgi:imidazoleglycerol phosphate dehydratase HisB